MSQFRSQQPRQGGSIRLKSLKMGAIQSRLLSFQIKCTSSRRTFRTKSSCISRTGRPSNGKDQPSILKCEPHTVTCDFLHPNRDQDWPSSGIVIYHVDLLAPKQQQRGYPDHPNFPKEHYQVAVVQRDGKFDIEQGANPGDVNDFWQKGMILENSCDAWPNSCSYQGGLLRSTGITITIDTDSGFIMSFTVTGLNQQSNKATSFLDPRRSPTDDQQRTDPETVGTVVSWVIGTLSGVAVLIGFLIVLM
jgi:hypothetical protein